jgi:hypothetical protein
VPIASQRAAKKCRYSITSSASASNLSGISKPGALARLAAQSMAGLPRCFVNDGVGNRERGRAKRLRLFKLCELSLQCAHLVEASRHVAHDCGHADHLAVFRSPSPAGIHPNAAHATAQE